MSKKNIVQRQTNSNQNFFISLSKEFFFANLQQMLYIHFFADVL